MAESAPSGLVGFSRKTRGRPGADFLSPSSSYLETAKLEVGHEREEHLQYAALLLSLTFKRLQTQAFLCRAHRLSGTSPGE